MMTRNLNNPGVWILAAAASFLAMAGCDDGESTGTQTAAIELVGSWSNQFGGDEMITETHWNAATIAVIDNDDNWVVTQNPADDEYFPSMYSVAVWTEPQGDTFYYCTFAFGLESEEAAVAADRGQPDEGDLDGAGCGGFAWTKMTRTN